MRIIAGAAKGRKLLTPTAGTRPLTGRVREALFSSLARRVPGARVLDLYAGSGSLGLEALSRGAASAVFVERGRSALRALRANVTTVGLGGSVEDGAVASFLRTSSGTYDLVFVDPPYADPPPAVDTVLAGLEPLLAPEATIVVHRRTGDPPVSVEFPVERAERRYGDATLYVLRRRSSE